MRFTIARKIWIGCVIIVVFGTIAMLVTFRGLQQVQMEMQRLAEVYEPIKWATHEMEINVNGIAVGTLGYLSTPHPKFRELITNDESDFERFYADYLRLAYTEQEKEFGRTMGRLFEQFISQSRELKETRDRHTRVFGQVVAKLEEIDRAIDHQLQPALDERSLGDMVRLQALNAVEADIAEVGMMVANYRWSAQQASQTLVLENIDECRATFARLQDFEWKIEDHRRVIQTLVQVFEEAAGMIIEVIADEDVIQRGSIRFLALRDEIDSMLDEQMQPLALALLEKPHVEAQSATSTVVHKLAWLIPLFVLASTLAALALTRTVTRPLNQLVQGTEAVSRGDLAIRLFPVSNDEFADLARAFNRMVVRLEETLVSRELLQKSEQKLKQSLEALQVETSERIRSEKERSRLEVSLRHVQALSAMGTLVAGVAHQVRNPLFGISSVLDAMEARLGEREEYHRYLPVLREQVNRVTILMHELMEYGNARNIEYSMGSLAELIHEAVKACRSLAEKSQVGIEEQLQPMPLAAMDRPRLNRVLECLLENGIQHAPAGSAVTVRTKVMDKDGQDWIEIRVEDLGPGFKEEELPHVFEPFYTRRHGGTGLGLALVERIVESHGGQVAAANRLGGGAAVTVTLPVQPVTVTGPGPLPIRTAETTS